MVLEDYGPSVMFPIECFPVFPRRDLWRLLAWSEVSEWPGIL